jgi:hypothetical protein
MLAGGALMFEPEGFLMSRRYSLQALPDIKNWNQLRSVATEGKAVGRAGRPQAEYQRCLAKSVRNAFSYSFFFS